MIENIQGVLLIDNTSPVKGIATLSAGTVSVASTSIAATSIVMLTPGVKNASSALGTLHVSAITPGVGFTVTSYSSTAGVVSGDLSSFFWEVKMLHTEVVY